MRERKEEKKTTTAILGHISCESTYGFKGRGQELWGRL